jgi:hypothetical protein
VLALHNRRSEHVVGGCWRVFSQVRAMLARWRGANGGGWLTLAKILFAEVKFYLLYKKYKVDHIIPIIYIKNE